VVHELEPKLIKYHKVLHKICVGLCFVLTSELQWLTSQCHRTNFESLVVVSTHERALI